MLEKIEKYLSINLEVLLLYIKIILLSTENTNISQPVKWDNSKKDEYVEYLTVNENNEITNIENILNDMLLFQDVSINDVNEVVTKVGNIVKNNRVSKKFNINKFNKIFYIQQQYLQIYA